MRMRALKSWYNRDHEGMVQPDDEFEAPEYRARELERLGLAIPCLPPVVRIVADPVPPAEPARRRRR